MDAVIKVGGSLAKNPPVLRNLCKSLGGIGEKLRVLVVPGGGEFADVVREVDGRFGLVPSAAHRMAILGMDQFGVLLSEFIPNSCTVYSLDKARQLSELRRVPIFLPSKLMFQKNPLDASWDVTSDSIAAYIAHLLNADKLVLVTDVDGVFTSDPKSDLAVRLIREVSAAGLLKLSQRTSVDLFLPRLLLKKQLDCYVVNGAYPTRIEAVLNGEKTICTHITSR